MPGNFWLCLCSVVLVAAQSDIKDLADINELYPTNILSDAIDSFIHKEKEYLIVNFDFKPQTANLYCSIYKAQLADVKTEEVALFLADALAETDHYLDNVWTSGYKKKDKWVWGSGDVVDNELLEKYYLERSSEDEYNTTRGCLAFRRNNENEPRFLSLSCRLPRPPICEKKKDTSEGGTGSTHQGWIQLGDRHYKIYQDRVAFENASKNCMMHDKNARLAVVTTIEDAEKLARYMIIGRPKISTAWIGVRWSAEKGSFTFPEEDIVLGNETDKNSRYPPWRGGKINKASGCVLFNGHRTEANQFRVQFIEARCERYRPYICYKKVVESEEPAVVDGNIKVYYHPRPWEEAKQFCESFSTPGKLPEPRTEEEMKKLLYIMGESDITIHQLWIGGLYHEDEEWRWVSDNSTIPRTESYPVWLTNDSYTEELEDNNRCLNLDRENHNVGIFYGTDCSFAQRFICVFEKGVDTTTTSSTTTTTTTTTITTTTPSTTTTTLITPTTTTTPPEIPVSTEEPEEPVSPPVHTTQPQTTPNDGEASAV